MSFYLSKRNDGQLIPIDEASQKVYQTLETGDIIKCSIPDKRNIQHHRKFFALINLVFESMPEQYDKHFPTADDLRYELIKRAGFYRSYTDLKGNTQYIAESISFDKMGQRRFEELYSRVVDVVVEWFAFDREFLESELIGFM